MMMRRGSVGAGALALLGDSAGALALLGVASACGLWVLAGLPRPLTPSEPPSLRLPAAEVRSAMAEDERLAAEAPRTPLANELDGLLLAQGEADHGLSELRAERARRMRRRAQLAAQLQAQSGRSALLALRARAVMRFQRALTDAAVPETELPGVFGVFPNQLARAGVTRGGREVAPRFVTQVLYKVRWNRLHSWAPSEALKPVERRAFFGWQALHATHEPLQARLTALRGYAEAGGERVSEALSVLLFQAGQLEAAGRALGAAQARRFHIRLRNYGEGLRLARRARGNAP